MKYKFMHTIQDEPGHKLLLVNEIEAPDLEAAFARLYDQCSVLWGADFLLGPCRVTTHACAIGQAAVAAAAQQVRASMETEEEA